MPVPCPTCSELSSLIKTSRLTKPVSIWRTNSSPEPVLISAEPRRAMELEVTHIFLQTSWSTTFSTCQNRRTIRIIHGYRNHVDVQRENQAFAVRGIHVASQALTGNHQFFIERIVGAVGPGFCVNVSGSRRIHLNFY